MTRSRVVQAGALRAGVTDLFWHTAPGRAVLAGLDDLSLHSLLMQLVDLGGVILGSGYDDASTVTAQVGEHESPGVPGDRLLDFFELPLIAALLRSAGRDAAEVIEGAQRRMRLAFDTVEQLKELDGTAPEDMPPLFYEHAYNELRIAVAALLAEFAGMNVDA